MQTAQSSRLANARTFPPRLDVPSPRSGGDRGLPIVFVVEDDVTVRDSLARLIRTAGWQFEAFPSAHGFLARPRPGVPSCLVVDAARGGSAALELQKQLAARSNLPIIFFGGNSDVATAAQAMKAGAFDFLTTPIESTALVDAVRGAIDRSRTALCHDAAMRDLRECYASLTPREREVMALVVVGRSNKQIGGDLGISEITVKAHRGQVMSKMKADSLADLVRMVARLGLRTGGAASIRIDTNIEQTADDESTPSSNRSPSRRMFQSGRDDNSPLSVSRTSSWCMEDWWTAPDGRGSTTG